MADVPAASDEVPDIGSDVPFRGNQSGWDGGKAEESNVLTTVTLADDPTWIL